MKTCRTSTTMKCVLAFLIVLLVAGAGFARDFPVRDFGATGDGKTDDGAAIQKAVDAAVAAGPGSRVVFEQKTYRLDWRKNVPHQIALTGAKDIVITGNRIEAHSKPCIEACSVSGLTITNNNFSLTPSTSTDTKPLNLTNIVHETISGNSSP